MISIFKDHNYQVAAIVSQDFVPRTLGRYQTLLRQTWRILQSHWQQPDIDICEVNHDFITFYEFYLRLVHRCNNNLAVKSVNGI